MQYIRCSPTYANPLMSPRPVDEYRAPIDVTAARHRACNPHKCKETVSWNCETQQRALSEWLGFNNMYCRVMYAHTYLPSVPRTTTSHCDMQRDKDSGILAAAWPRGGAQRLQTGGRVRVTASVT